ncbi:MAG: hypothetical protein AB8G77_15660 [Rhodothermales bacterium]
MAEIAFAAIFVQIKALFVFDAAHRAQKERRYGQKWRTMHLGNRS